MSEFGALTQRQLVLAMVIQEPMTSAELNKRVMREFPLARYARNTGHSAIQVLEDAGLVKKRGKTNYATLAGRAMHRRWMAAEATPPGFHDAVSSKLPFVSSRDELDMTIDGYRALEIGYEALATDANVELARARGERSKDELRHRLLGIKLLYDGVRAEDLVKHYEKVRDELETLRDELPAADSVGTSDAASASG